MKTQSQVSTLARIESNCARSLQQTLYSFKYCATLKVLSYNLKYTTADTNDRNIGK